MTFKEIAQQFIDNNYSVTPVKQKRPFINEWQKIKLDEILDPKHNSSWKQATGLGVILGEASGIICLDIDVLDNEHPHLVEFKNELLKFLPPIYSGKIGNPARAPSRFFKYNGEEAKKFINLHVEILSNGNQTVVPPSIHPDTGLQYNWVGRPLYESDVDDFPSLPPNLINWLTEQNAKYDTKKANTVKGLTDNKGSHVGLEYKSGRCMSGSHNRLSAIGVAMFFADHTREEIVERLIEVDKFINAEADCFYFVCPSRNFKTKDYNLNAKHFVDEIFDNNKGKAADKKTIDEYYAQEKLEGFTLATPSDNASKPKAKYIRKYFSLYGYLKHRHEITYIPEMKQFMMFDGNKFNRITEDDVRGLAQDYFKFPQVINQAERNTLLDLVKAKKRGRVNDFILSGYSNANFLNGSFSIKDRKLLPHNSKDRFNHVIDCHYTEDTKADNWQMLLYLICKGRTHMMTAIEEFVGYCIYAVPYDEFNKLLILDGSGSNGKSTLIRVIKGLVGDLNISSVGLMDIANNRFSASGLLNKLVNFCAEEPKEAFSNTGPIKKLTGGDPMMIEEKHRGAFSFTNMAKMIISYNKMPFFPDDSEGMKRRIILIPCEQNFDKNPELKMKAPEALILGSERAQVVARCMRAYEAVVERGHFTRVAEGDERVGEMITESSPIKSFIKDCCEFSQGAFVTRQDVWLAFEEYTGKRTKYTKIGFGKEFKKEAALLNFKQKDHISFRFGYENLKINQ